MGAESVTDRPFVTPRVMLAGLVIAPIAYGIARVTGGPNSAIQVQRALFLATLAVEAVTFYAAARRARQAAPGARERVFWFLVTAFMGVRLLAEVRLLVFTFEVLPPALASDPWWRPALQTWLRYLYVVADLLVLVALVHAFRGFRRLRIRLTARGADLAFGLVLVAAVVVVHAQREYLGFFVRSEDPTLLRFREIATVSAAIVAAVSFANYRHTGSRGGNAARRWLTITVANMAHLGAYVALASFSFISNGLADMAEQIALWVFAGMWCSVAADDPTGGGSR